jgi:hypothetical protein
MQGPQSVRVPAVTCIEALESLSLANLVLAVDLRVEIPVDSGISGEAGVCHVEARYLDVCQCKYQCKYGMLRRPHDASQSRSD